jgi:hypothetical protein
LDFTVYFRFCTEVCFHNEHRLFITVRQSFFALGRGGRCIRDLADRGSLLQFASRDLVRSSSGREVRGDFRKSNYGYDLAGNGCLVRLAAARVT